MLWEGCECAVEVIDILPIEGSKQCTQYRQIDDVSK